MRRGIHQLQFVGSFHDVLPELGLPEIAFAGRSNVGKSSALNTLLQRKNIARTSNTPGRTQAINLFKLDEEGVFADLPGYGFARVPQHVLNRWKRTIEGYLAERADLRLVVVLVDARRDPTTLDGQLLWALVEQGVPSLVVATKVDKLTRNQRQTNLAALRKEFQLPADQPVAFSSVTAEGREEVWARIDAAGKAPRRKAAVELAGPEGVEGLE